MDGKPSHLSLFSLAEILSHLTWGRQHGVCAWQAVSKFDEWMNGWLNA